MSIDKTLKRKRGMNKVRSVYTRQERIAIMTSEDKWTEETGPFNLPKQRIMRMVVGKKKKKKAAEGDKKDDKKKAAKKK